MAGFDEPAPDGQSGFNRARVVEAPGSVAHVAVRRSHGRVFFAHFGSFAVWFQCVDDFFTRSGFELFLLRASPLPGRLGIAGRRGFAEVFADVKAVDEEPPIAPKNLSRLP